jgi:hypothetical protein
VGVDQAGQCPHYWPTQAHAIGIAGRDKALADKLTSGKTAEINEAVSQTDGKEEGMFWQ